MTDRSEADCVSNDLVERVALAIDSAICDGDQSSVAMELTSEEIKVLARAAIAVVLEEAAKMLEARWAYGTADHQAAAIRALVKEPQDG